jgi:hypothetical protein
MAVNDAGQCASQGTWGSNEAAAEWRRVAVSSMVAEMDDEKPGHINSHRGRSTLVLLN